MSEPCRMIIDVDPGIDDAMAIVYALRRPGIKLEALTTTFGNTDTAISTENALRVLELLGRPDIPVARGVSRSLVHPFVRRADHVHGKNGIGDIELAAPKIKATGEHASDLIIRTAKENPSEITLCAVGPVTNVALALTKAPEVAKLLRKIVLMGSTIFHPGILGPAAPMVDANFANDPEAAHIVLRAGAAVTLVGMDVTMTTLFSTAMMDEVRREGDDAAKTLMGMTSFYVKAYQAMYPGIEGCGLHDPLAVAIAEDPSLARTERMFVDVELHGEFTRGQTIADRRGTAVPLHNADVCVEVDRARFVTGFLAAIKGR
ncbi:MAG TPA: nucleoside hydrolase [Roseiarcus sp.]|nr:nucleoside hydrolase [Roseiarcus sp.]